MMLRSEDERRKIAYESEQMVSEYHDLLYAGDAFASGVSGFGV